CPSSARLRLTRGSKAARCYPDSRGCAQDDRFDLAVKSCGCLISLKGAATPHWNVRRCTFPFLSGSITTEGFIAWDRYSLQRQVQCNWVTSPSTAWGMAPCGLPGRASGARLPTAPQPLPPSGERSNLESTSSTRPILTAPACPKS